MKRPVIWAIAAGITGLLLLGTAYLGRHYVGKILRKIRHGPSTPVSGPPVEQVLQLHGRHFFDVLGYPPFYLQAPDINSAVFVTRLSGAGSNIIHVFNLKTEQDIQVRSIADFGRYIGLTNGGFLEYVESANPAELLLSSEMNSGVVRKTIFHIDLRVAKVSGRDIFLYDIHGRLTNTQHVPGF